MPSATYPNQLARGVETVGTFVPFELWAGESDIVTSQGVAGTDLAQFTPIKRDTSSGNIIAAADGDKAIGFTAQPAVANGPVAYYVGGAPNHMALNWPGATSTLAKRKAMFDGTMVVVSALL